MNKKMQLSQHLTKKANILLLLAAFICHVPAMATELTFWQGIGTYHLDRTEDESSNEENKITAVFYDRWFVGFFDNSYSRRSELFGYNFYWRQYQAQQWSYHYGVGLAVATGYREELDHNIEGHLTPGISSFAGFKYGVTKQAKVGFDLLYLPTDDGGVFVYGLSITQMLGQ